MTPVDTESIERRVRGYVASEIEAQAITGEPSRVGCIVPLQYADGDDIVVWIELWGDRFRVSDYGEAFLSIAARPERDQTDMFAEARELAAPFGVEVKEGSLVTQAGEAELGDAVWRVAMASARVADRAAGFRQRRHHKDHPFTLEVERELRVERKLPVEREAKLQGSSGHVHKATLFIPTVHAVLEPVEAAAHYNAITAIYARFGDLSHANGYRRLSLVDDRASDLSEDLAAMLVQVSDVVRWTRREDWLTQLLG